jgi:hypothetical protein
MHVRLLDQSEVMWLAMSVAGRRKLEQEKFYSFKNATD